MKIGTTSWIHAHLTIGQILSSAVVSAFLLFCGQWILRLFMRATDLKLAYAWRFDGSMEKPLNIRPSFDFRNRSKRTTYRIGNIAYRLDGQPHWCDNKSIAGAEIGPGSFFNFDEVGAIPRLESLTDATNLEVFIRFQNAPERKAYGPGQQPSKWRIQMDRIRCFLEKIALLPE